MDRNINQLPTKVTPLALTLRAHTTNKTTLQEVKGGKFPITCTVPRQTVLVANEVPGDTDAAGPGAMLCETLV